MENIEIRNSVITAIQQISFTEWLIFITSFIYIILAIFENIWCWLWGIIASALSIYLCITGQLFLESGLQLFYVGMGIYGWLQWKKCKPAHSEVLDEIKEHKPSTELLVTRSSGKKIMVFIFSGILLSFFLGFISQQFSTQALPYLDGFITAFSLIATWMTAKKLLENWIFWFVIDGLAIYLFAARSFYLIAFIYLIYTALTISGYTRWKKKLVA